MSLYITWHGLWSCDSHAVFVSFTFKHSSRSVRLKHQSEELTKPKWQKDLMMQHKATSIHKPYTPEQCSFHSM